MILDKLTACPATWLGSVIDWEPWRDAPLICSSTHSTACEYCGCENPGIMRFGELTIETPTNVTPLHPQKPRRVILQKCTGCGRGTLWDGRTIHEIRMDTHQ